MLTNKSKNNRNNTTMRRNRRRNQSRSVGSVPQVAPPRNVRYSTWSRYGPEPPCHGYEGKSILQSSKLAITTDDFSPLGVGDPYNVLYAFVNMGYGARACKAFAWNENQSDAVEYLTPYLGDSTISSARAVKSSLELFNSTNALNRMPGVYVLRTSQRFATANKDVHLPNELSFIAGAIKSHPDTAYIKGSERVEICNIPNNDTDYFEFMRTVPDLNSYLFSASDSVDTNRPMSVIWVYIPYKMGETDSQTYSFNLYTEQRCRHAVGTALATLAKHPPVKGAKAQTRAAADAQVVGSTVPQ